MKADSKTDETHRLEKIARVCEMMGSNFDPEVLQAAKKANQMVRASGMTWTTLVMGLPYVAPGAGPKMADHQAMAEMIMRRYTVSKKDYSFLNNIRFRTKLSGPQRVWFDDIRRRTMGE